MGGSTPGRGGLKTIQGKINNLSDYFTVDYLIGNDSFNLQNVKIRPIKNKHVDNELSFGLDFEDNRCRVYISGDSKCPEVDKFLTNEGTYDKYQLIFQDCEFQDYPNSVHAQFYELCKLPDQIKNKMWLYHYSLNSEPIGKYEDKATLAGFAGIVYRGQVFNTEDYQRK